MAMVTADASAATADAPVATADASASTKQPDAVDKEYSSYNGASTAVGTHRARGARGGVVDSVVARWRREDMLDKSPLALHAAAAAFAFVALVLVASNQQGDWMQFDRYQEYRYLLAIAALAFVYSLAQALRHAHRMRGGADPASTPSGKIFDFVADQAHNYNFTNYNPYLLFVSFCNLHHWLVRKSGSWLKVVAYLLMSALSAATPITNRMRTAVVNNFTDATAAAISMAFLAFVALALSATVSGYKLSKQTYM